MLAVDLRDLIRLFAPRSLRTSWTVSTVKSGVPGHEWFEATGEGGEFLEAMAQLGARISGPEMASLAERTRQVIWGEFSARFPPDENGTPWLVIRAIDSTFYEVETTDPSILKLVRQPFRDVRAAEQAYPWPFHRISPEDE